MLSKNEIKYIQSLKARKNRIEQRHFVVEGHKMVAELIQQTEYRVAKVYAVESFIQQHRPAASKVDFIQVTEAELERISFLQAPQQALALAEMKFPEFEPFKNGKWSLLLDNLQDPGNLGTIIRIADWFGINTIYATPETADLYNPKVVQATMGSFLRVKMIIGPCAEWLSKADVPVYGTAMDGQSVWQMENAIPGVIIIGNEGSGISPEILKLTTANLSIPKLGNAESLNAGVAAGIMVSHLIQLTNK